MGDEFIRTDYERLFQRGLDSLKVKYRIGIIYCFKCRKTFTWTRSEAPEQCNIGFHKWTEPGQYARPDFLIYNDLDEKQPIACVRIDGPVHDKRRQIMKDRFQAHNFLDSNIKVFIFRNEWLLGAQHIVGKKLKKWIPIQMPDFVYTALALVVVLCSRDDVAYKRYLEDKEVRHYLGIKPQHLPAVK